MSTRSQVVAAQAIVVAVLVVVVVATLLRPDSPGTLIGIDAPQVGEGAFPNPGAYEDRASEAATQQPSGGGRDPQPGTGAPTPNVPAPGQTALTPPAAPIPPATGTDADGEDSPADDQYADTVSRLMSRLD